MKALALLLLIPCIAHAQICWKDSDGSVTCPGASPIYGNDDNGVITAHDLRGDTYSGDVNSGISNSGRDRRNVFETSPPPVRRGLDVNIETSPPAVLPAAPAAPSAYEPYHDAANAAAANTLRARAAPVAIQTYSTPAAEHYSDHDIAIIDALSAKIIPPPGSDEDTVELYKKVQRSVFARRDYYVSLGLTNMQATTLVLNELNGQ